MILITLTLLRKIIYLHSFASQNKNNVTFFEEKIITKILIHIVTYECNLIQTL